MIDNKGNKKPNPLKLLFQKVANLAYCVFWRIRNIIKRRSCQFFSAYFTCFEPGKMGAAAFEASRDGWNTRPTDGEIAC